jgi:hypothetical protein
MTIVILLYSKLNATSQSLTINVGQNNGRESDIYRELDGRTYPT